VPAGSCAGPSATIAADRRSGSSWSVPPSDHSTRGPHAGNYLAGNDGDHYVHWGRFRATLTGAWLGLPPTNRPLDLPFAAVIEVRDGHMIGEALYYDLDTLCTQAGFRVEAVRAAAEAIRRAHAEAHATA
jgi:hypothetical protein